MVKPIQNTKISNYFIAAILMILILPFIAMIINGLPSNIIDGIVEYMIVFLGFLWAPLILMISVLNWEFEYTYSPLLAIIFWVVPPLLFAVSFGGKRSEYKDTIVAVYMLMAVGMFISLIIIFAIFVITIAASMLGIVDDPFTHFLRGV